MVAVATKSVYISSFAGHSINQYKTVEYLGCQLDFKLGGEGMPSKVLKK